MSRFWTPEQESTLRARYPHEKTANLVSIIGKSIGKIYQKAAALGLKKTAAYLASPDACRLRRGDSVGAAYRFKKGQLAFNKGVKGISYPGMEATQFKKGVRQGVAVKLYQPIGAERISKDGYLQRKINDDMPLQRRWRAVHIVVWEEANGLLPKGHAIVFKDGNKRNFAIDNLELVTRAELMRRNSYHNNYPKEVAQLIQLRGAVQRQINKRSKQDGSATTDQ